MCFLKCHHDVHHMMGGMLPSGIIPVKKQFFGGLPCSWAKHPVPSARREPVNQYLPKHAAGRQWLVWQILSIRRIHKHSITPPLLHSIQPDHPTLWILKNEKDENDRTSQPSVQRSGENVCNTGRAMSITKRKTVVLGEAGTRTVVLDPP